MTTDLHSAGVEVEPSKEQLEKELLSAQKLKLAAEIDVLRKTTPLVESIKVVGSMVLGLGGAIAAVAGFQLAEVKAEKFKLEAREAEKARDSAKDETQHLKFAKERLEKEADDLQKRVELAKTQYEQISDRLAAVEKRADNTAVSKELRDLQQTVNAADINLRTLTTRQSSASSGAPLDQLIEQLFAPTASARGAAYEELVGRFSTDTQLVPKLVAHAESHISNSNGVYNTLVLLSRLDHRQLGSDLASIRSFASKARANGAKTSDRVDKLLERLPRD